MINMIIIIFVVTLCMMIYYFFWERMIKFITSSEFVLVNHFIFSLCSSFNIILRACDTEKLMKIRPMSSTISPSLEASWVGCLVELNFDLGLGRIYRGSGLQKPSATFRLLIRWVRFRVFFNPTQLFRLANLQFNSTHDCS